MKLIHCADLHLDSKMETNLTREQARQRRDELLQTFAGMAEYAKSNCVRAIIIAGDMFDTANTEQKRVKNRVLELIYNAPEIDFIYLRGNHDRADYILSIDDRPSNLRVFSDSWTSFRYGRVVVTGRELTKDAPVGVYDELSLGADDINIVTLHGQTAAYDTRAGGELISLPRLQNKYIDYLALGHLHEYQREKLDNRGVYCYCGCLEGRGFDECGQKGFVLLEARDDGVKSQFIPAARRTFHEIHVSLSAAVNETQMLDRIMAAVSDIPSDDLVKVVLTGEMDEEADVDTDYILRRLEPLFFFVKVHDRTQLRIDYTRYRNDVSLKGEFIRCVEAMDTPDEEKRAIILTGIRALAGRELDI